MSNVKVLIRRVETNTKYGDHFDEIEVFVDEKLIGGGSFGGAPEDNSKSRRYRWVEPALVELAKVLGADVMFLDEVVED